MSLIQYEPRQANVLYPLGMPLIVVLMEWIAGATKTRPQPRAQRYQ